MDHASMTDQGFHGFAGDSAANTAVAIQAALMAATNDNPEATKACLEIALEEVGAWLRADRGLPRRKMPA
jgi:hypothetical protein